MITRVMLVWVLASIMFTSSAAGHTGERWKPVVAGKWRVLYEPIKAGPRVNDHSIFRDINGDYRFVGITSYPYLDLSSSYLGHAVGESLLEPFSELHVLFFDYPDLRPKWAPHVIVHKGVRHMYVGPGRIRHYISEDGINWTFHDYCIDPGWHAFRDSMVLELPQGGWLMYCTDRDNTVSVYHSDDLYTWTDKGTAFRAIKPAAAYPWWFNISSTESPFVVRYKGAYYLSVCLTSALEPETYAQTVVLRSEDPYDFGVYAAGADNDTADLVTIIKAHAAEYIRVSPDRWYITTCGWKSYEGVEGKIPGSVCIAPLKWERAD